MKTATEIKFYMGLVVLQYVARAAIVVTLAALVVRGLFA